MPYSLQISPIDLPCSLSFNICHLNSFVYCFRFITIVPVLLYNLLYFYPYLLSQILYQIQLYPFLKSAAAWRIFSIILLQNARAVLKGPIKI